MTEDSATRRGFSPRRAAWFCLAAVALLSLASFLSFGPLDRAAAKWAEGKQPVLHEQLHFRVLNLLGKGGWQIALLGAWALGRRRWRPFVVGLVALALTGILIFTAKGIIQRPRPREAINPVRLANDEGLLHSWSFPSGDTATAFAFAVILIPFLRARWTLLLFAVAAAIGFGRVANLYHYPSDVAAGAALGIACGLCTLVLCRNLLPRAPADLNRPAPEPAP